MTVWLARLHRRLVAGELTHWGTCLSVLLIPLSLLYGSLAWLRERCYRWGVLPVFRASLPVVSVGNLAAGGTGKTPLVDLLLKRLRDRGWSPAVVSRGYAGSFRGRAAWVSRAGELELSAEQSGDEPLLLARNNLDCPVVIARRRRDGLRLLEQESPTDLVILDDAFQHRAVARDVDLVVLDGRRPLGNGWPLPAGNLREWPGALQRADLLLLTRCETAVKSPCPGISTFTSQHCLAAEAIGLDGRRLPVAELHDKRLAACAGIASPEEFFSALTALGLSLQATLALGDHVAYNGHVLERLSEMIATSGAELLLTTEKDAVKLRNDALPVPCYYLPMTLAVENEDDFIELLLQRLEKRSMKVKEYAP